jgi:hypothetical protein
MAIRGNFGEAESGQVGCDDAVAVGEARDQFAVLK